jgi:hypothetical protein
MHKPNKQHWHERAGILIMKIPVASIVCVKTGFVLKD